MFQCPDLSLILLLVSLGREDEGRLGLWAGFPEEVGMAYTRRQTKVKMQKCGGECGQSPRPRAWGASTGLLMGLKRAGGQSERSLWSSGQGLGFFCRGAMVAAISSGHMGSALLVDEREVTPTSA